MCETKQCRKCKEVKSVGEFSKKRRAKDGLKSQCKGCVKAYYAKWRAENQEKEKARQAKYRAENQGKEKARQAKYRAENQEKVKAANAKYRAENQEKVKAANARWRAENPEKEKACTAKWKSKNPDKVKAYEHRRRALEANAPGNFTADQWKARLDYHGNKCVYCGCGGKMTLEHQIPLARGGSNHPANLAPACDSCNKSKGDKTPAEFAEYRTARLLG